jgi:hypothetical protein
MVLYHGWLIKLKKWWKRSQKLAELRYLRFGGVIPQVVDKNK